LGLFRQAARSQDEFRARSCQDGLLDLAVFLLLCRGARVAYMPRRRVKNPQDFFISAEQ